MRPFLSLVRVRAVLATLMAAAFCSQSASAATTVRWLGGEKLALETRLRLIRSARTSIELATFQVENTSVTDQIVTELAAAGKRGVKVRFLIDNFHNGLSREHVKTLNAAGCEVRQFSPMKPTQFSLYRMHDKLFVVDRQRLIIGGRNMGDAYYTTDYEIRFQDREVLLIGPVAREASCYFFKLWNSKRSEVLDESTCRIASDTAIRLRNANRRFNSLGQTGGGATELPETSAADRWHFTVPDHRIQFIRSSNLIVDDRRVDISDHLTNLIRRAQGRVIIESPYFYPTKKFDDAIINRRKAGVPVIAITNSMASNNKLLAQAGYECRKSTWLKHGVQLFEFDEHAVLHTKCWIVDNTTFIGSFNLDSRAEKYDNQCGVLIHDANVTKVLLESMEERDFRAAHMVESCVPTIKDLKNAGCVRAFKSCIYRLTVPILSRHL